MRTKIHKQDKWLVRYHQFTDVENWNKTTFNNYNLRAITVQLELFVQL